MTSRRTLFKYLGAAAVAAPLILVGAQQTEAAPVDNLTTVEQLAQDLKDGKTTMVETCHVSWPTWDPEAVRTQLFVEQYLRTPEGQREVAALAQEMLGTPLTREARRYYEMDLIDCIMPRLPVGAPPGSACPGPG